MRVLDRITGKKLSVEEAYERFFDGFYNLGLPTDIFGGTMVLSSPKHEPAKRRRHIRNCRSARSRVGARRFPRRK